MAPWVLARKRPILLKIGKVVEKRARRFELRRGFLLARRAPPTSPISHDPRLILSKNDILLQNTHLLPHGLTKFLAPSSSKQTYYTACRRTFLLFFLTTHSQNHFLFLLNLLLLFLYCFIYFSFTFLSFIKNLIFVKLNY